MELKAIKTQTSWNEASTAINDNNNRIATEINKLSASTYKCRGYFGTIGNLKSAFPASTALKNNIAYVGNNYPFTIYRCDGTQWLSVGQGGDVNVSLGDYYTNAEVDSAIADYIEPMTQSEYDALPNKEDKFYAIFEDEV